MARNIFEVVHAVFFLIPLFDRVRLSKQMRFWFSFTSF